MSEQNYYDTVKTQNYTEVFYNLFIYYLKSILVTI